MSLFKSGGATGRRRVIGQGLVPNADFDEVEAERTQAIDSRVSAGLASGRRRPILGSDPLEDNRVGGLLSIPDRTPSV